MLLGLHLSVTRLAKMVVTDWRGNGCGELEGVILLKKELVFLM